MLSVRLSKELETRLERLSRKTERSKTFFVQKALQKFLDEQEEIEWATQEYKEFLNSGGKTVPFEKLINEDS